MTRPIKDLFGNSKAMTVCEAALIMGISEDALRVLLQRKDMPWGMAWRGRGKAYQYYINRKKFMEMYG